MEFRKRSPKEMFIVTLVGLVGLFVFSRTAGVSAINTRN